jgi:hypothetical protein
VLTLFLAIAQAGSAVVSMIQPGTDSAMAGCEEAGSPQKPMEGHAVQCLAHCASEMATATVSPLAVPLASSERVRAQQPRRESMSPAALPAIPSHPPPKRILYQSFQI